MSFTGSCRYLRSSDTTNLFLFPQIVAETLYSDWSLFRCGIIRHILQLQIWILAHNTTSAGQQRSHHVQSLWRYVSSHLLWVTVPDLLGRNFFKLKNKQTSSVGEHDTCHICQCWLHLSASFFGKKGLTSDILHKERVSGEEMHMVSKINRQRPCLIISYTKCKLMM